MTNESRLGIPPTDEECEQFAATQGSTHDLIRRAYLAGMYKAMKTTRDRLRPLIEQIAEELGPEECNNCDLGDDATGAAIAELDELLEECGLASCQS